MWYNFAGSNKLYPLTIERVKEIQELNKKGVKPTELQAVEVVKKDLNTIRAEFVDVVGQTSLKSLERNDKKRRDKNKATGNNKTNNNQKASSNNPNNKQATAPKVENKSTLNNLLHPNTPKPKPKVETPNKEGAKQPQAKTEGQKPKHKPNPNQHNKKKPEVKKLTEGTDGV